MFCVWYTLAVNAIAKRKKVQREILIWYDRNQRNLPWRGTTDPYAITVSEVMLQQTQVDRVKPKYVLWLKTFPTVSSLAKAPLRKILTLWSGLGYNSRAVRLRLLAREIKGKHHGQWPTDVVTLKTLPGFGSYTAGAVAAFAFGRRVGIIDTNVRRVMHRIFLGLKNISPIELQKVVEAIVPAGRHGGTWHHAVMDFGAMICTSRRPRCLECPVRQWCRAYPAILEPVSPSPAQGKIRFIDTDRFWRGRIIAMLTSQASIDQGVLFTRLQLLGKLSLVRFQAIVGQLLAEKLLRKNARGRIQIGY